MIALANGKTQRKNRRSVPTTLGQFELLNAWIALRRGIEDLNKKTSLFTSSECNTPPTINLTSQIPLLPRTLALHRTRIEL